MIHFLFSKRFSEIDFIKIKNPAIHEITPIKIENVLNIVSDTPEAKIFEFMFFLFRMYIVHIIPSMGKYHANIPTDQYPLVVRGL